MHFLYIIYSQNIDKFYIGETTDVNHRIELHNRHAFKNAYSKAADDWILKLKFQCENRKNAVFLEKFIKRMKSRKFINKVIEKPEILHDVLNKK
ncbi:GIY-YIG nuclease family protein [Psychroflexus halocasei]|uniref:Putative endonuclease n=1 Tax=Psychroflexus halocasei TaxID=908615 RepID=A0A1H4DJV8_9FLAO|nr:GIY-YIG nuclease family protein [Psychroflexus halocasei]SEA72502.1 putative endonuclease [Psychroflexus halocasei]